jgi:RimJ/RimL family protein N-acetyltransferase
MTATSVDGRRVTLRALGPGDGPDVVRWRSDPDVARQMLSEGPPTLEEHDAWFAAMSERGDRREFVIIDRESGRAVGTVGLSRIGDPPGEAEYGILIGERDARGRGFAAEATELILAYAFGPLGLRRVRLTVFEDNAAAFRLYERCGFRPIPASRTERVKDGERRATVGMAIERADRERRR